MPVFHMRGHKIDFWPFSVNFIDLTYFSSRGTTVSPSYAGQNWNFKSTLFGRGCYSDSKAHYGAQVANLCLVDSQNARCHAIS